ncbi:mandelate racemase/muconate lactonizing enzyme family protein [Pelagibius sp. Alg239-R121]|uniref:mandelate racemase/muconate lactonizing enzyme family protein n=1 Tax=Pelagibius sp. Alg239-R121 TaxID=2993448 RepID=UPI0024A74BF6|nr:mandelate racemase/muconate lactonizing enzyme family protein [Pelagibius sp. Alg239-R121]
MKITDIRERSFPLDSPLRNAYIDFSQMTCSVVAVETDVLRDGKPVTGYGFNSNGRYGAGGLLRERFLPRLQAATPNDLLDESGSNLDPFKIHTCMMSNEKPGGHGERSVAVGVVDMAVWDAVAKIEERPLNRLLADRFGGDVPADERVYVYAAGGYYYPGKGLEALQDEMRGYLDLGYRDVKMKIGGASLTEDLARIEAVLDVVGKGEHLMVDANGRFDLQTAVAYAEALAPYGLKWYEEAGDPLDYDLQAALAKHYGLPMATGENLFSLQDARNLIRHGGMRPDRDWLQFDCALSYGLVEYLKILAMLRDEGWSSRRVVPHGGHQMSLNIAAGLHLGGNESYPRVFQPYGGFADDVEVVDGFVGLPDCSGIGMERKAKLYELLQTV